MPRDPARRPTGADVAEYLTRRFDGAGLPDELLPLLMERTEGNPFFVAVLIEDLLERTLLSGTTGVGGCRAAPTCGLRSPKDCAR